MKYEQRPDDDSGTVTTGLRERFEVSEGEFEVPSDLDAAAHQRLIDSGHDPLDSDALPAGVTYNEGEAEDSESGSESDSSETMPNGSDETDESEEGNAEATSGQENEAPEPPDDLDEMSRAELYQFGNEELDLGLAWSGEEALDEEGMREAVEEALEWQTMAKKYIFKNGEPVEAEEQEEPEEDSEEVEE